MAISNKDYLVALNKLMESAVEKDVAEEVLPKHVIVGIKKGQADFEAGRYITFDTFKKKLSAK
ncbi:MAG TPA: hypothetical protein VK541_11620 [Pedobacter sp.]|uniref:hypothetical protein n=1 Tax=Pedobacter sp. TaxID=1411316 RepID=UPI002C697A14|nr:hypothetical protein [Pedobacter sp.]HMI03125.1 hypothetical protein [Pedobacter sp.]